MNDGTHLRLPVVDAQILLLIVVSSVPIVVVVVVGGGGREFDYSHPYVTTEKSLHYFY